MTETQPSMKPGQPGRAGTETAATAPTAEPPVAAASSDCGCGKHASAAATSVAVMPEAAASMAAPALRPDVASANAVTATWHNNTHITGLWSINQDRNCWAYLDGIGWRGLSGASVSGVMAMNLLMSHAYDRNRIANCYEGDDGRISQLYVW